VLGVLVAIPRWSSSLSRGWEAALAWVVLYVAIAPDSCFLVRPAFAWACGQDTGKFEGDKEWRFD